MNRVCRFLPNVNQAVIYTVVLLCLATFDCSSWITTARGDDPQEKAATPEETDPDYEVPDGTPKDIMKFITKLKSKTKFANQKERIDHLIKLFGAQIAAADKILSQETSDKEAADAAKMKLQSLMVLARNEIGDAGKVALESVLKLKSDDREQVRKIAAAFWAPVRIINLGNLDEAGRKELTDEILKTVGDSKFAPDDVSAANELGQALAEKKHTEEAGQVFDRLADLAKSSKNPKIQDAAKRFEGIVRRMRLPGNFMAIEGKKLNGDDFDWSSYRGKIVLVDFWATWCGPCVAEMPNVMKNYKKYHDKGFEIVAISLDTEREELDKFIAKKEIPWVQLYDEELQKERGWNHPMAEYFGINAIPATFLVDQEGKVISSEVHGEELTKLLEKLLGKEE